MIAFLWVWTALTVVTVGAAFAAAVTLVTDERAARAAFAADCRWRTS